MKAGTRVKALVNLGLTLKGSGGMGRFYDTAQAGTLGTVVRDKDTEADLSPSWFVVRFDGHEKLPADHFWADEPLVAAVAPDMVSVVA